MSKGAGGGDVVLHPAVAAKLREIEKLRERLALLVEEHETLTTSERDMIIAQYNGDVGHLEYELFRVNVGISELRRRIALLQAEINRGDAVTYETVAALDERIKKEFEESRAEIVEREREIRKSSTLLNADNLMKPEDWLELKSLYRKLCLRYHPDVGGNEAEKGTKIWPSLQRAYRERDLEQLRALADLANPDKPVPETPLNVVDDELNRLRSRIESRGERIAETLASPPFSYRKQLDDPQWVKSKQTELKLAIDQGKEREAELRRRFEAMAKPAGTITH